MTPYTLERPDGSQFFRGAALGTGGLQRNKKKPWSQMNTDSTKR